MLNNIDPTTLRRCKHPVFVTTSSGRTYTLERKTIEIAYKQQYGKRKDFNTIHKTLEQGKLFLITPRGCFNIIGGLKITKLEPMTAVREEEIKDPVAVIHRRITMLKHNPNSPDGTVTRGWLRAVKASIEILKSALSAMS